MIASLPMYWRAETAPLWQAFWSQLQAAARVHGTALPNLTPPEALPDLRAHWLAPDLALSMTCGLPFRTVLKGKVTYIGTLDFGLNAPGGHYFSRLVTRHAPFSTDRPRGTLGVLAYNSADSQSGWAATQMKAPNMAPHRFSGFVETGSHAASLAAVAGGRADIAFIDAVTWRLLKRYDRNALSIFQFGRSAITPALPLIAAKGTDPAPLRAAFMDVTLGWHSADPMAMGGPLSFHILPEQAYFNVPLPTQPP